MASCLLLVYMHNTYSSLCVCLFQDEESQIAGRKLNVWQSYEIKVDLVRGTLLFDQHASRDKRPPDE